LSSIYVQKAKRAFPFRFALLEFRDVTQIYGKSPMSDFGSAERIVSVEQLAQLCDCPPEQIAELTRLGILRPINVDDPGAEARYELLASVRAYIRHYRTMLDKEN
jgi:hypothetical protein